MNIPIILEVVIGLIFIYLLLSLLATAINEALSSITRLRGVFLKKALTIMLQDIKDNNGEQGDFIDRFYSYPLIEQMGGKRKKNLPSYVSKEVFSEIMLFLLNGSKDQKMVFETVKAEIKNNLKDGKVKSMLLDWLEKANGSLDNFRGSLEGWFDSVTERSKGWFKRSVQVRLFIIGLILVSVFNANTIHMVNVLSKDQDAREQMMVLANDFMERQEGQLMQIGVLDTAKINKTSAVGIVAFDTTKLMPLATTAQEKAEIRRLANINTQIKQIMEEDLLAQGNTMGIGWSEFKRFKEDIGSSLWAIVLTVLGFVLTAFAITLGAPFWFDLLNKVMSIRGSGTASAQAPVKKANAS